MHTGPYTKKEHQENTETNKRLRPFEGKPLILHREGTYTSERGGGWGIGCGKIKMNHFTLSQLGGGGGGGGGERGGELSFARSHTMNAN